MKEHTTENGSMSVRQYTKDTTAFLNGTKPASNSGEFPEGYDQAPVFDSSVSRRTFMTLLSGSIALTAVGCRKPDHKLVPAVKGVDYQVPGLPVHYTTAFAHGNVAHGVLVKSVEGRPIKLDGNDKDQLVKGASGAIAQASILNLYDPDRMRAPRVNGGDSSVTNAVVRIATAIKELPPDKKVAVLISEHASPSFNALTEQLVASFPSMMFVTAPALVADNAAEVNKEVLGIAADLFPNLEKAQTIVSIDRDFLGTDKCSTAFTRAFSAKRKPSKKNPEMSRLVVVEAGLTLTGSNADYRFGVAPGEYEAVLAAVCKRIFSMKGVPSGAEALASTIAGLGEPSSEHGKKAVETIVHSLEKAKGQACILVGAHLPKAIQALSLVANIALGAVGDGNVWDVNNQVPFSAPRIPAKEAFEMAAANGEVGAIIFADANIEYYGSGAMRKAILKVPKSHRFSLSLYHDETADLCSVTIPMTHFLEAWGDAQAPNGDLYIQQPMIAPLNAGSLSIAEFLMQVATAINPATFASTPTYYDFVRQRWNAIAPDKKSWDNVLRDGVYMLQARTMQAVVPQFARVEMFLNGANPLTKANAYVFPSHATHDGYYANNGWLMELADPVTKITWDNVALVSKKTAEAAGLKDGDVVTIKTPQGNVQAPIWMQPGMVDGVWGLAAGFGRSKGGDVAANVGYNTSLLFSKDQNVGYLSVEVEPSGAKSVKIATTQNHHDFDSPDFGDAFGGTALIKKRKNEIIKELTLMDLASDHGEHHDHHAAYKKKNEDGSTTWISIVDDYKYKGHRWGMTIDMSSCTGCNACVVACQSENNIPVVGKEQVILGREMQWIRLDRYYVGDEHNTQVAFQPMMCQHCENAPCENVCPVAATTHSPEGLNEMTYNRCVGTRYCANNCPYKVRRFNFLNYHVDKRQPLAMVYNPEVTMRMRGIMEKCTFCVQRINEAKYHAKDAGRNRVQDGEVVTACQQACPAGAIYFGDINDKSSLVNQARDKDRSYEILGELNIRPQITYLAKVRNVDTKHA